MFFFSTFFLSHFHKKIKKRKIKKWNGSEHNRRERNHKFWGRSEPSGERSYNFSSARTFSRSSKFALLVISFNFAGFCHNFCPEIKFDAETKDRGVDCRTRVQHLIRTHTSRINDTNTYTQTKKQS